MLKRTRRREEVNNPPHAVQESFLNDADGRVLENLHRTPHQPASTGANSGIRDNYIRGTVGSFLKEKIQSGSTLSVVSAYFTIYAYEALKVQLNTITGLRFLFGEPRFIQSLDPEKIDKKAFKIEDDGLWLVNRLEQKRVAHECAQWITEKVHIRSVKHSNLLHGKMYHIAHNGVEEAILGSSNFTLRGLGLSSTNNNIELNLEVDSNRDRRDLKAWFDAIWHNADLVEDVKEEVLLYLGATVRQSPSRIHLLQDAVSSLRTVSDRARYRRFAVREHADRRNRHLAETL